MAPETFPLGSKSHIFSLNGTWQHVIEKLEAFSTNTSPLMEHAEVVLNGKVTKDGIYDELFQDTMDEELDNLTAKLCICNPVGKAVT